MLRPPLISLLCLLALTGFFTLSAWAGQESLPPIVQRIEVHSKISFTYDRFVNTTRLREGARFSWDGLHEDMRRLFATGLFGDVEVRVELAASGVTLDYTLIERRVIRKIDLEGELGLPASEVREALGLKEGDDFVSGNWDAVLDRLGEFYRREGYESAAIRGETRFPEQGGEADLRIEVTAGEPLRIGILRFEGNLGLPEKRLASELSLSPGGILSFSRLDRGLSSLRTLYDQNGYLMAKVGAPIIRREKNVADLTIPIDSGPSVEIRFDGKKRFDEKTLRDQILVSKLKSVQEAVLIESARRLADFYRSQNYLSAQVGYRKEILSAGNKIRVTFLLDPDRRFALREIRFEGNEHFESKRLKRLLQERESGLFHRAVFSDALSKGDAERLAAFYRQNGFLHPKIAPEVLLDRSKGRITLVFKIDEGAQTLVETIEFEGGPALPADQLKKELHSRVGAPFNETNLREDRLSLEAAYARLGHIRAQVDPSTIFSDDGRKVRIAFRIDQGERSLVGEIHLSGNDFTHGNVIRRELLVKPGDPFNPEAIIRSKQNLYRLGFFSEVQFEPTHPDSTEAVREMDLRVKERPAGTVSFGIGYGDFDGLRGFVEVGHRNLVGTGRAIRGRVGASRIERRFDADYREPWLLNSRTLAGRAGLIFQNIEEVSFTRSKFGVTVGVEKSITERMNAALVYEVERDRIYDLAPGAVLSPLDVGNLRLVTLNPSWIWDRRDNPFEPTSGFIEGATLRAALKVLGSETDFNKLNLLSSWYVSLLDRIVLALSARGGIDLRLRGTEVVPISERFFVGGQGTVRGYEQDHVGVPGQTLIDGTPTGGEAMMVFNEELRFLLPYSLGLVLFFDHGNVWIPPEKVRIDQIKTTTGAGLRYRTPVGPIRLDFGYKLNREPGEDAWRIHFTLGEAF
ncbi:MAG TPA: outer membrane protein assembly factor BamA [Nitrospiria bacterium]|nr:outer membrane protein assembly factor BamA [Nitrospiria bacterium]